MGTQIVLAYALFVPHPAIFNLTPVLLAFSLFFGLASGIIAANVLARLSALDARPEPEQT